MYAKSRQFKLYFSQNIKKPTQIIDPSQPANLLLSIKLYLHSINKMDNYFLHFKTSVISETIIVYENMIYSLTFQAKHTYYRVNKSAISIPTDLKHTKLHD